MMAQQQSMFGPTPQELQQMFMQQQQAQDMNQANQWGQGSLGQQISTAGYMGGTMLGRGLQGLGQAAGIIPEDPRIAEARKMMEIKQKITDANIDFLRVERRFNYTTPTSFLELISFYRMLLDKKRDKITDQIDRLEIGLGIMKATIEQVEGLQKLLDVKMVDVEQEKAKTGELIEIVGRESLDAQREHDIANIQATETNALAADAE
jgi:hypothetical protein